MFSSYWRGSNVFVHKFTCLSNPNLLWWPGGILDSHCYSLLAGRLNILGCTVSKGNISGYSSNDKSRCTHQQQVQASGGKARASSLNLLIGATHFVESSSPLLILAENSVVW